MARLSRMVTRCEHACVVFSNAHELLLLPFWVVAFFCNWLFWERGLAQKRHTSVLMNLVCLKSTRGIYKRAVWVVP